jgi:phage-related holin
MKRERESFSETHAHVYCHSYLFVKCYYQYDVIVWMLIIFLIQLLIISRFKRDYRKAYFGITRKVKISVC